MQKKTIIDNVKIIIDIVSAVNEKFHGQVWWRGEECYDWKLEPSVFRDNRDSNYEQNIGKRFKLRAPSRHFNTPKIDDLSAWLFLMQHYGLPTRLLDWTESPLIASFFSVKDYKNQKNEKMDSEIRDGALYALDPYHLNVSQTGKSVVFLSESQIIQDIIKQSFYLSEKIVKDVLAIQPTEIDQRLMVQLSVFTIHGTQTPIPELLNNDKFLLKMRIPGKHKELIFEQLKELGIRESNLFPDLEHLSKEVGDLTFEPDKEKKSSPTDRQLSISNDQFRINST